MSYKNEKGEEVKVEDLDFKEEWPTLTKILLLAFVAFSVWMGYQGVLLVLGIWGWPLTLPSPQASMESYQEYVKAQQQGLQVFQWILGPLFIGLTVWLNRRLVRRLLNRRTVEVEKEE